MEAVKVLERVIKQYVSQYAADGFWLGRIIISEEFLKPNAFRFSQFKTKWGNVLFNDSIDILIETGKIIRTKEGNLEIYSWRWI